MPKTRKLLKQSIFAPLSEIIEKDREIYLDRLLRRKYNVFDKLTGYKIPDARYLNAIKYEFYFRAKNAESGKSRKKIVNFSVRLFVR